MYIQGNLAHREQVSPLPRVRETKRVVVRKKSLPIQEKLLYLFTVVVCVIVASVIIWRYAQIYEMNKNIHEIQGTIRELQAENNMLKEKIDRANDPNQLRKEATQYGLGPIPEENKIRIPDKSSAAAQQGNSQLALKR